MKKSQTTLLSIVLIAIILISGAFLLKGKNNDQSKDAYVEEESEEENQDETITYENGDFVYTPTNEEIGYDSEEAVFYYENLLNLYLVSEVSDEQAEELANVVDGHVVGKIQGSVNMLQIQVEEESLKELNQLVDRLKSDELVKYAGSSTPSFVSDLSGNGGQMDSRKVDEVNPDGVNWWAEAINAYSAWYYMDNHKGEFKQVEVAVLESGKLGKKGNDIDDSTIDKSSVNIVKNAEGAKYKRHANLVTKTIAADKNAETIRGVAEPIAEIKFTSMGDISEDEIADNIEASIGSMSEAELICHINDIQDGGDTKVSDVKVINNSWGNPPMSKVKRNKVENGIKRFFQDDAEQDDGYDKYLDAHKNSNDGVSVQLIIALDELLKSEKNGEFLIIQSAGNGYSRTDEEEWDTSLEAKYTGIFTNINKVTYTRASALAVDELEDIEEFLNHIIIVGGAEQTEDKDGYQSPEWASYGDVIDIVAPASELYDDPSKEDEEPVRGTSYAAPMVSGAAALVWSYNPDMEAGDVKELLLDSAEEDVKDNVKIEDSEYKKQSYPMLNMTAFLKEHPHNSSVIETYLNEYPYYNKLIETYRTAIREEWEQSELDKLDLGPLHYEPQPLSSDYGYELRDINGDGLPELVLGVYRDDVRAEICEIYALQDKEPVKVFENAIRTNINIYKDGTIRTDSSVRAGSMIQYMFYELNDDGTKQWKAGYERDTSENPSYHSLTDPEAVPDESITEGDGKRIREKYKDIDIIYHAFTPFVLDEE